MPRLRSRRLIAAAAAVLLVPLLSACSPSTSDPTTTATAASPARCAENKAAGHITFLTGYGFAASAGILDVLAASKLGYFQALCLDVDVRAGSLKNVAQVSAGIAQIVNTGGASDVLTADAMGGKLLGIATYGNTGLARLIALKKNGYSLSSFAGRIIGYHGAMPPQVSAMLVKEGVPLAKVKLASVDFNPLLLTQGSFDGMTGYVSADVPTLQAAGDPVTVWNPADYGIQSTFGTQAANRSWAIAHPTAVEDFLRASFHAFDWLTASKTHVTTALGWAATAQGTGFDAGAEAERWSIESGLALSTLPKGQALGTQSVAQWSPEASELVQFGVVKTSPDVAADLSTQYVSSISKDGKVVWPAP